MKTLWTVSFFLMCHCTVSANQIRAIPVDEFNEAIMPGIKKAEKAIHNFEMEFEMWGQRKRLNSTSDDWKDSGQYAKVRLLADGQRTGRIRLHVFVERWGSGKAMHERSYALSYNGKQGKELFDAKTSKGKTLEVKECTILSSRSDTIRSQMSAGQYVQPFILNFLGFSRDGGFSKYLKPFMDPKFNAPVQFSRNIDLVELENTECVRIQIKATGVSGTTYWLDPAKNYAPLAMKHFDLNEEDQEVNARSTKVLKFKKVSDHVWFPVKTQTEAPGIKTAGRWTITVSEVRINIKDLRDVNFDLSIPDDYKIIDKRTKK